MSRMLRPIAVLLLLASPLLASCSKSSTILALTITTSKDIAVSNFKVTLTSPGGPTLQSYTIPGAAHTNDADIFSGSFFDRQTLDFSGPCVIAVDAVEGDKVTASAKTDESLPVDIIANETTAATVALTAIADTTNPGTGGASGTGGVSGTGGGGGGAGGATGGSKGGAGGGAGHNGGAGGSGGRNGGAGGA